MAKRESCKTLAIYDDAAVFGGHEQMSCCGITALARESDLELKCFVAKSNEKLRQRIEGFAQDYPNISLHLLDFTSQRFQGVRSRFALGRIGQVAELLRTTESDAILVLQGDIELSSIGVLAGRKLGIPTVSYIPVPHTLATMQAKLGALRDPFNSWLFSQPDSYITISEGMKKLLQERGAAQPVEVVFNGFDPSKTEPRDRELSRKELALPLDRQVIAMVGRIEYKQKRQDFLLDCFARYRERFPNLHLMYVGSGPDEEDLKARVAAHELEDRVTFVAWTDGLSGVYSAIDALALPSRFEGVPLVMLEAMSREVPIVGSRRDGMAEFLPSEWLFKPGDLAECADVLSRCLEEDQSERVRSNRDRALKEFSMEQFDRGFVSATRKLCRF